MKITLLSISLALVALISCEKDTSSNSSTNTGNNTGQQGNTGNQGEAPELGEISYNYTYKSLLLEFTSTGCPGCGSWGKPTFYSLVNEFKDQVIPIAAHIKYGDPMISGVSEALAGNRTGSRYTPQIWVNDKSIMALVNNRIDGTQSVQNARDFINNATKNEGFGLGSVMKIQNGKAYTKYGVHLKAEVPAGEYYVASYLMQDGIKAQQAGISSSQNPATHNYVVRQAANATWGNKISKKDGEELKAEWPHTYNDDVEEGQYLITVIWKKEGNIYVPMNISKP